MKSFPKTLSAFYWSVIKKFPVYFGFMFLLLAAHNIFSLVFLPYINKWMFSLFENAMTIDFQSALRLVILIVVMSSITLLLETTRSIINGRKELKVKKYTGLMLYRRIYDNDMDFFINRPAGQIASKASEIHSGVINQTAVFWSDMVGICIGLLLLVAILFNVNLWIAIITLGCSIIRMIWQLWRQKIINKASKEMLDAMSVTSGIRTDSLGNIATAKLFARGDYENEYIFKQQQKEIKLDLYQRFLGRWNWLPSNIVWYITRGGLLLLCFGAIRAGTMDIAGAAFALASFGNINQAFERFTRFLREYSEKNEKAKHAYADIIQPQTVVDKPGARNLKINRATVDFDDVSFNYGGRDVIKNFDLHVGASEKIGIVGLSGAGKTTLMNLILRLYDVKRGAIKIDGADIRDVAQDSVRRAIAFVPQEPVLFNRTLLENIKYARPNATKAQVVAAAKSAFIHDFIIGTDKGYETLVGNRGIKLSGGQKQRVAIARAILKDAPILILDEATSALDSETEAVIQKSFDKLSRGRTTIAIAHRLSTLRNMDRIVVMDKGRIVESGTHAALLRKRGIYAKLWKMQSGGFIKE